jgi:SAM-dependent methyltransferase
VTDARRAHWDQVYGSKAIDQVSWYEPTPERSLALIRSTGIASSEPIIDVGGGASYLIDELLNAGFCDLTVLDISGEVLGSLRERLGERAAGVTLLQEDITAFRPPRRYAVWHDRAVFHFLTEPGDRRGYIHALREGLQPNGHAIIATFGPAGPERCSGLPVVRYDASSLTKELGNEFRLVDSSLVTHQTPWGAEQQFLYCRFVRG